MITATTSGVSADCGHSQGIGAARRRAALREFGARLSDHRELTGCGRKIRKGRAGSPTEILEVTTSCRCKWLCPTCGHTAWRKEAAKLKRRLRRWTAHGGAAALLTLTQSHCNSDGLAQLWSRLDAGWAALVTGSGWTADKQIHGVRGYVRITEVVHSPVTGWHVHFHVILFLERELDPPRLDELRTSIAKRFAHGVARSGGHAAVDCQHLKPMTPGTEGSLATYCFKGTTLKASTDGSRTPMDILDNLETTGEGLALWDELTTTVLAKKRVQVIASTRIDDLCTQTGHYS